MNLSTNKFWLYCFMWDHYSGEYCVLFCCNITNSCELCSLGLLPYAIISVLCFLHYVTPLPCSSVALLFAHWNRNAGVEFLKTLLCGSLWGQIWCLCFVNTVQHSNLLFLLQQLYVSLPVPSQHHPCHSVTRVFLCFTFFYLIFLSKI